MSPSQGYIVAVTRIIPLLLVPLSLLIVVLSRRQRVAFTQVAAFAVGWLSLFAVVFNFVRPGDPTILQNLYSKDVFTLTPFYLNLVVAFLAYLVAGIFGLVWRARKDTGRVRSNWVRESIFALFLYALYIQFGFSIALGIGLLATAALLREWWSAGTATFVALLLAIAEFAPFIAQQEPFNVARYAGFITFSGGFLTLVVQLLTLVSNKNAAMPSQEIPPLESTPHPSEINPILPAEAEVSKKTILLTFLVLGVMTATIAVLVESNVRVAPNPIVNCILIRTFFLFLAVPFFYCIVSLLGVMPLKRARITLTGSFIWFVLFLGLGILNLR